MQIWNFQTGAKVSGASRSSAPVSVAIVHQQAQNCRNARFDRYTAPWNPDRLFKTAEAVTISAGTNTDMIKFHQHLLTTAAAFALALPAAADGVHDHVSQTTINSYGLPGLIDMPTANTLPDGEIGITVSYSNVGVRGTLAFQVLPDVTATFRYTGIQSLSPGSVVPTDDVYYDRSFDLHWQVIDEGTWVPAIAIGIRDIAGTGIYSSEYIVATRHFGQRDRVAVTAGLGWGRLGQRDSFTNPLGVFDAGFETRPGRTPGDTGGTLNLNQFFRGDAAVFGGIEWQASDRLRLQLEYSSDIYAEEVADGLISAESGVNIGATYQVRDGMTAGAYVLGGDTFGVSLAMTLNPDRPSIQPSSGDPAPRPLNVRTPQAASYAADWVAQPGGGEILRDNFAQLFEDQGLHLETLTLDARRATIRVRNTGYNFESQALGRVLRAMSAALPPSVEVFEVIFIVEGIDTSRIRVSRTDLERLEFDPRGAELILAGAQIEDARTSADPTGLEVATSRPRLTWGLGPYVAASAFDPENPLLFDVGVELSARYRFGAGLVADAVVRASVFGTFDQARIVGASVIPPNAPPVVRSDSALYRQASDAYVERLTLTHFGRPGENLYSRVTFGYLERMFAGISGELLWQPANSRLGLGLEVNHVWARDYDGGFGLRDYSVTTGHVSAYYRLTEDFDAQLDVGRYLAGDWGATITLDRTFDSGWSVGAFATFTDVPFESFGEGSFDKGISLEIPLAWFTGNSIRSTTSATIRPLLRDGGARLNVEGRLHDLVIDYTRPHLAETEAMIWR